MSIFLPSTVCELGAGLEFWLKLGRMLFVGPEQPSLTLACGGPCLSKTGCDPCSSWTMLEAIYDAMANEWEWLLLGMGAAGTTKKMKRCVRALWDAVPQNHIDDISQYRSPHQNWLPSGVIKHGWLEHVPFRSMVFTFLIETHAKLPFGQLT